MEGGDREFATDWRWRAAQPATSGPFDFGVLKRLATPRIYLAGPEVFSRERSEVFRRKKELCAAYGFEGVSPLDAGPTFEDLPPRSQGYRISNVNEHLISSCDVLLANITPFRGPSADVGTAFEMGFARALGKPVLAYTNVGGNFQERTLAFLSHGAARRETGSVEEPQQMAVESFDLVDNLMLDGAVHASGASVIVSVAAPSDLYTHLEGFAACLEQAAALFGPEKAKQEHLESR